MIDNDKKINVINYDNTNYINQRDVKQDNNTTES